MNYSDFSSSKHLFVLSLSLSLSALPPSFSLFFFPPSCCCFLFYSSLLQASAGWEALGWLLEASGLLFCSMELTGSRHPSLLSFDHRVVSDACFLASCRKVRARAPRMISFRRHFLKGAVREPGPSEGHQPPSASLSRAQRAHL